MIKNLAVCLIPMASCLMLQAVSIDTNDPILVSAFQSGATAINFENIPDVTPQTITSYHSGDSVSPTRSCSIKLPVFNSRLGGAPGTNWPALYQLSDTIASDAKTPATVLGPNNFDLQSNFQGGAFMELFFPEKVSKVGFG